MFEFGIMFRSRNAFLLAKATLKEHAHEVESQLFQQRLSGQGMGQLMRDYIYESLYAPKIGFFNHDQVITPMESIDFSKIKSRKEFNTIYQKLTETSEEFLTPVELYQPYYGQIIARYLVKQIHEQNMLESGEPIYLFEVGAGRGTLVLNILDHLKEHEKEIYDKVQYRIIEISSSMVKHQKSRLSSHGSKVKIFHQSIFEWKEQITSKNVFVILMEVLDNLPHDKVKITQSFLQRKERIVGEGRVYVRNTSIYEKYSDIFRDPIIQRYLFYTRDAPLSELDFSRFFTHPYQFGKEFVMSFRKYRYIPTMLMRLLEILHKYIPHHQLIISDFDELPANNDIKAWNAPTIQRREPLNDGTFGVKSFTHCTQPDKYTCDIFFATDFDLLYILNERIMSNVNPLAKEGTLQEAEILKHSSFLKKYDDLNILNATQLSEDYNAATNEFENQSFFLTRRKQIVSGSSQSTPIQSTQPVQSTQSIHNNEQI